MILPSLSTRIPGGAFAASLLVNARQFPESLSAWNAAFPSVTAPVSLWPFQDATPSAPTTLAVDDTIGSCDLTSNSNGDERYHQTGDPYGRYGVLLEDLGSHLRAASTSTYDQTTGSFSCFFRFVAVASPASGHWFCRKKTVTANSNGWGVVWAGANGYLLLVLDTPSSTESQASVALSHADGNYHDVLAVVDRTNNEIRLTTDLGSTTTSIAAHAGGSLTTSAYFGFGDTQGNFNAAAQVVYTYGAFFNYALTSTHWNTIRAGG